MNMQQPKHCTRSGNPFAERDLIIVRLDQVSRSEELQARLAQTEWDLIICDEAHKLSASLYGNEIQETKRYKLGKLFGQVTRHLLLLTATPHNGKEEDFQLFLALLDPDRFEGAQHIREGAHKVDASDLMRRMVKETLLKFDGRPLFPERKAYTVNYTLSPEEDELYEAVTSYVREQFNRAEQLDHGDGRRGNVGFALTILQRRLASSPEAIYQSLRRRRERLEERLHEEQHSRRMGAVPDGAHGFDAETLEDLDDAPEAEIEQIEEQVVDNATAARTIAELQAEIAMLRELERKALALLRSGHDRKWNELQQLLQDNSEIRIRNNADAAGAPHKLVIFTEYRDTLSYLQRKLTVLFGDDRPIVSIHGGIHRDDRRRIEAEFRDNPQVTILVATDAAGEGINLQRAHLMVNYDLPWNPNRLEQRFGRIHRIGQTEVCHLWNLVAPDTREGHVYARLLTKLKAERNALDGQVFDVLGEPIWEKSLRDLMIEAVRYGDDPQVRARLDLAVDNALDRLHLQDLLEQRSLVQSTMDVSQVLKLREDMERYAAKRLQPHYIKSFFLQAFALLGGALHARENGRYTINNVPAVIRNYARDHGLPAVATQYGRICFEKADIQQGAGAEAVQAAFVCPGHPLLDAVIGLTLERYRDVLKRGAVLVDETDPGREPRMMFYLEQSIRDARTLRINTPGAYRVISREVHFVEVNTAGAVRLGGGAPYLDYRPATAEELAQLAALRPALFNSTEFGAAQERIATAHAINQLVPRHLDEVRQKRLDLIARTEAAVNERLTREINYWDQRANELREHERAGRPNARLNWQKAKSRADELAARLDRRMAELQQERQIVAESPIIAGGTLIVPIGLLLGERTPPEILDTRITEQIAMHAVMEIERHMGHDPRDVSADKLGYDIESRDPVAGRLRFIEVKGRRAGAETVTVTRNEILHALNALDEFILALVEIGEAGATSTILDYVLILDDSQSLTYTRSMITTITGKNQVTLPAEIVRALELTPGTQLDWSIGPDHTLIATPVLSRAQRAEALIGAGRRYLRPGSDPVRDLIVERQQDDGDDIAAVDKIAGGDDIDEFDDIVDPAE
jgi:superfamily II DNA or RNA helicase/bifunctional DNA-binding transcriptional regulator/antitoxin component of YhaV-PrlF toxin-antitoxin module